MWQGQAPSTFDDAPYTSLHVPVRRLNKKSVREGT